MFIKSEKGAHQNTFAMDVQLWVGMASIYTEEGYSINWYPAHVV